MLSCEHSDAYGWGSIDTCVSFESESIFIPGGRAMDLHIFESKAGMGAAAAQRVVELLKGAISERGVANVI